MTASQATENAWAVFSSITVMSLCLLAAFWVYKFYEAKERQR